MIMMMIVLSYTLRIVCHPFSKSTAIAINGVIEYKVTVKFLISEILYYNMIPLTIGNYLIVNMIMYKL